MNLILVGLNHKTADVALREKLAFKAEELPEALGSLLNLPTVDESLILSTCNRVEIAAAVKDTEEGFEKIVGFLVGKFGIDAEEDAVDGLGEGQLDAQLPRKGYDCLDGGGPFGDLAEACQRRIEGEPFPQGKPQAEYLRAHSSFEFAPGV